MSIADFVRKQVGDRIKHRRVMLQANAEVKARKLEDKAEYARKLKMRLDRQEKAKKDIQALKDTKTQIRQEKVNRLKSNLGAFNKRMDGVGGASGGAFGGSGPVWGGEMKTKPKKKKKKQIIINL